LSFLLKNGQFKVLIAQQGRLWAVAIFHLIVKLHFQEKISSGTTAHLMLEPFFDNVLRKPEVLQLVLNIPL
jgi:hypothetical protein